MAKSDLKRVLIDSCALLAFIKGEPAAARLIPLLEDELANWRSSGWLRAGL